MISWLKRLWKIAAGNFKFIEGCLIALSFWWAFILITPYDTFGSSPAYSAMADFAPEEVWSVAFLLLAITKLYGMIFEKFLIRQIGLTISAGMWLFVAAMFAVGHIATTATGAYFVIFCMTLFVCYKVGEQRGQ